MLLHGFVDSSFVNGPGERCVVWFQGCANMGGPGKGCSGCWNPETHTFDKSKYIDTKDFIEQKLATLPEDLEGITFSGGDPVQHIEDVLQIINWILENRSAWSIGMFTGYSYKEAAYGKFQYLRDGELIDGDYPLWFEVERVIDFAVMGRYNRLSPVNEPLVTSSNQELKLFSDRYKKEDFPPQAVEVFLNDDGLVQITGFPVGMDVSVLINETRER